MSKNEASRRPEGIWLALSGGGFRAALFHYGCFKRLKELGLLPRVHAISAASGGALAAALLTLSILYRDKVEEDWEEFETKLLAAATQGILGPIPFVLLLHCLVWCTFVCYGFALFLFLFGADNTWSLLIRLSYWTAGASALIWLAVFFWLRSIKDNGEYLAHFGKLSGKYVVPKRTWLATLDDDLTTALRPADIRQFILHHRLFEQMPLGILASSWQVYMVAADLNTGREMVFSANAVSDLSSAGASVLWYQQWRAVSAQGGMSNVTLDNLSERISFRVSYESHTLPISVAVAASSAYPPLFQPVVVHVDGELVGSMVDGGVVDNHAVNVAYQMAKHITVENGKARPTFSDATAHVVAIDASAPATLKRRGMTSRLRALFRLPDILHSLQVQSAKDDVQNVARISGICASAIGLRVGLPRNCEFQTEDIAYRAARIRTHFDAFSRIECGVLAYLGYCWIEEWALAQLGERSEDVPLRSFEDILPREFAVGSITQEEIVAHLRYSHLRLRPARWIARRFMSGARSR